MKIPSLLTLIIVLFLITTTNQLQLVLPVPEILLVKATLSINKLTQILQNFNTKLENKFEIYKAVYFTKHYLNQLKASLLQFNNIVLGNNNGILGNNNFVIGNYNTVIGSNNWVFVSKFTGNIDGDLLIADWRVQLDKFQYIKINPRFAISYLDEERNKEIKFKYTKKSRKVCKFDKWANIQNQESKKYWEKFQGFKEFSDQQKNKSNHYQLSYQNLKETQRQHTQTKRNFRRQSEQQSDSESQKKL